VKGASSFLVSIVFLAISYAAIGSFYEVNDEHALVIICKNAGKITSLEFGPYFQIFAGPVSWFYAWMPGVPWYGVVLYAL